MTEENEGIGTREVLVRPDGDGRRLDVYLSTRFPTYSRSQVKQMIQAGQVVIEGRRLKASSTLLAGEVLMVTARGLAPVGPPPAMPKIIHEDDRLLVVDKPAGMLAHPTGIIFAYALVGVVRAAREQDDIDLAHRLDRETSGINVLTKDRAANAHLKAAFKARTPTKVYQAIVHGNPEWDTLSVDAPIGSALNSEIRIRRGVNPQGLTARTDFRVLARMEGLSLIEVKPHTGRTHQIRVHLEHVGHPILGDKIYGQPDRTFLHHLDHGADATVRAATGFPRHALHAHQLTVPHPDGTDRTFQAPLGVDLQAIVDGQAPAWPCPAE